MNENTAVHYIAFLRGINAGITMKMADLRPVFERLGFENVRTVLATGNVLFETTQTDKTSLTKQVEAALLQTFNHDIAAIIYTKEELLHFVALDPFKDVEVTLQTRPQVTFLQGYPTSNLQFPYKVPRKGYVILGVFGYMVASVMDLSGATTPDLMSKLDKEFGKKITTRSWSTVERIVKLL